MTVVCGACNTENRDAAKFCKGCGRKIAQAWPQAPAVAAMSGSGDATLILGAAAPASSPASLPPKVQPPDAAQPLHAPMPPRARIGNGRWIVGLGTGVALLVAAAAWWGLHNRSQEINAPAAVALPPSQDAPARDVPTPPLEGSVPLPPPAPVPEPAAVEAVAAQPPAAPVAPEAVPAVSAASAKARKPVAKKQAPPAPAPVLEVAAPAAPAPVPEPVRVPTPQEACAGRNFIARAQCLADQCAQPGLASHPQCEAVRRQQRIEDEKRNPVNAG